MSDPLEFWRVPPPTKLRWRRWGDEFIVFNPASGDTHYLNDFAGAVLQYFEADAGTITGLIADIQMTGAIDPLNSSSLCDQVSQLVKEFDALGLIARVSP